MFFVRYHRSFSLTTRLKTFSIHLQGELSCGECIGLVKTRQIACFSSLIRPVDLVHPGNPEAEVNEGDVEGDGGGDEGAHVGVLHLQKVGEGQN